MTAKILSIQGERQKRPPLDMVKCRAFQHGEWDGMTTQEKIGRKTVWVARLECGRCGTIRTDTMDPRSGDVLNRSYVHPDDYDGTIKPAEARRIVHKHMVE